MSEQTLKSEQLALFNVPVLVKPYVRQDGTTVQPHISLRRKAAQRSAHQQHALFDDVAAVETAAPAALGSEPPPVKAEKPAAPAPRKRRAPRRLVVAEQATAVPAPAHIAQFGATEDAKPAQRRRDNAAALRILEEKTDSQLTAGDLAVLARYSGRGGIGDHLNEFYTRPDVAAAMWRLLGKLGVESGTVLEPSAGTGVFLHAAPAGASMTATELDPVSSRICRALHADHEVNESSLEVFATQDVRLFDAVIGNVPFGIRGACIKDDKPHWSKAEQYFLDTALDKTRAGGIVALIVPTGVMDAASNRHLRETLLRKGEFIAAHRLPNTAFGHSHTEVTSDIVLFRRRDPAVAQALGTVDQDALKDLGIWDDEFLSGNYFAGRGAVHVYGRMEAGWRAKAGIGQDITVSGDMDGVAEAIAAWVPPEAAPGIDMATVLAALPDDSARERARRAALRTPYAVAKVGDTKVENGVTYILQGRPPRWHRVDDADGEPVHVEQARSIGKLIGRLADGQADAADVQQALRGWVSAHGVPRSNRDVTGRAGGDKDLHRVIAAVNADGSFSDLVAGRQVAAGATVEQIAERLSLNGNSFGVGDLAAESGQDAAALEDMLFASERYARLPDGRWQTMGEYLTGELWPKVDAVREQLPADVDASLRSKLELQARRLDEAIAPKSMEDIDVQINSPWVPLDVVAAYFNAGIEAWKERSPTATWAPDPVRITFDKGVYRVEGGFHSEQKLLPQYLNRTGVREDDRPTIDRWNAEFGPWIAASEHRERVEDVYNRAYTGFVRGQYSDEPMEVPGLTSERSINRYHWAGLRWALDVGKGIIAADVGVGKTPRGLILAKLLKAHGRAKKPAFVVPKSILAKWVKEAEQWFPGARVMVVGETYSKDADGIVKARDDSAAIRNRKLHEIAQNEYDFIFFSGPAWNDIDLSPIRKGEYIEDDFWVQRGDALGNAGDKRRNQIREAYRQAVAKREFEKRSDVVYFDDLGIDALFTDEAHAYKNLYAARARFGENPKFLGGSGLSNRALDSFLKSRFVRDQTGGRNIFDLTATPTKNSPLEVYSMLSRSAPEAFERMGIRNSEEFLDRFCVFEKRLTLGVNGEIEDALCTTGFKNLDELREVMNRYIDRTTAEDVGLKLPEPEEVEHQVPMSPDQQEAYAGLRTLAEQSGKKDDTGDAHIFSIMDKMGKAAMDLELLDPKAYAGAASQKYETLASTVAERVKDGGQLIFCEHVDAHPKIMAALVAKGLKPSEIAIVNATATKTSLARQRVAEAFNAGKIKAVIGNKTMEEGLDLQETTSDIHHMDIPWEPSTLQQRNGRGRRQGNLRERIRLHRYLSKGSFDGYRYQTVAAKRDWMTQLWGGGNRVDNLAMASALSREDMLVMLAADPDEARRRIDANKSAAQERMDAERRAEAAGEFIRFRQMSRSYGAIKNKRSKSAIRLEQQVRAARQRLEASPHFSAKDALDHPDAVVVDGQTGATWRAGMGIEVTPSAGAPLNWPGEHSRWVIEGVMPDGGSVRLRAFGSDASTTVKAQDLRHGVKAVAFDADSERAEMATAQLGALSKDFFEGRRGSAELVASATAAVESAARDVIRSEPRWHETTSGRTRMWQEIGSAARSVAGDLDDQGLQQLIDHAELNTLLAAHGKTAASIKKPGDLLGLPDALIEHNRPTIVRHLRRLALAYRDGHSGHYGLVYGDAKADVAKSYSVRDELAQDGVRHLLPTAGDRALAIDAYKRLHRERKFVWNYRSVGRRGSHRTEDLPGVKLAHPRFEHDYGGHANPMASVLRELYPGAEAEAIEQLRVESIERARAAPSFAAAAEALAPTIAADYGRVVKWDADRLGVLVQKAQADGLLARSVSEAVGNRYARGLFDSSGRSFANSKLGDALSEHLRESDPQAAKRLVDIAWGRAAA